MKSIKILPILIFKLVLFVTTSAQTNNFGTWAGVSITKKLTKDIDLTLTPELRFSNGLSVDEYLIESSIEYEPIKYFSIGGKYRFETNPRESRETQHFHKYALDLKGKYKINQLKLQVRTRYSNYSEYDTDYGLLNPYLRYRLKAKYNEKKSKLSPFASAETFYQLSDNEYNKMRYTIGIDYKLNKNNQISLEYHYQDYLKKDYNRKVIAIQYKFKF